MGSARAEPGLRTSLLSAETPAGYGAPGLALPWEDGDPASAHVSVSVKGPSQTFARAPSALNTLIRLTALDGQPLRILLCGPALRARTGGLPCSSGPRQGLVDTHASSGSFGVQLLVLSAPTVTLPPPTVYSEVFIFLTISSAARSKHFFKPLSLAVAARRSPLPSGEQPRQAAGLCFPWPGQQCVFLGPARAWAVLRLQRTCVRSSQS